MRTNNSDRFASCLRDVGWSVADLFFVISGFGMKCTVAQHSHGRKEILSRRIARITPMYWAMIAATAALAMSVPRVFQTTHFGIANFIQSHLFIPSRD